MEFKSQLCTTREQSEKLLSLGLKKETADMVYHYQKSRIETMQWELRPHPPTLRNTTHLNVDKLNVFKHKKPDGSIMTGEEYFEELWGQDIPAWSLHRLMEIAMKGDKLGCITHNIHQNNVATYYELVISTIEHLIKIDEFNKNYLENEIK